MFSRKTKSETSPPKPPTKAEILEDLETFSLDHIHLDMAHQKKGEESTLGTLDASMDPLETTRGNKRDGKDVENQRQLKEWWETFEQFLTDIDKLEIYQKQFVAKKASLTKLDESISLMADDIHTRLTDSLEKAKEQMPENEEDLK